MAARAGRGRSRRCPTSAPPTWRRAPSRSRCSRSPCSASRSRSRAREAGAATADHRRDAARPRASWLRRRPGSRCPAGVIAAGTIYNYSFPGLAWLLWRRSRLGSADRLAGARAARRAASQLGARVRWARPLLIVGDRRIPRARRAARAGPASPASPASRRSAPGGEGGNTGFGNLRQALNPLEALGVWPSSEFRITPENSSTPAIAFYLGAACSALAAFAWGLGARSRAARGGAARGAGRRRRSATSAPSPSAPRTRRPRRWRSSRPW